MKTAWPKSPGPITKKSSSAAISLATLDVGNINALWNELAGNRSTPTPISNYTGPAFRRCVMCNQEFELSDPNLRCPSCHHEQFQSHPRPADDEPMRGMTRQAFLWILFATGIRDI